ncbi:MAG: dolichyl-phosphate beta-glucosyltransferase [Candidatus Omnitrophota bacterium]
MNSASQKEIQVPDPGRDIDLSVVMPVYNEEKTVEESIRRIEAFMRLRGKPWELIIVNDGSTDQTETIVKTQCGSRENGSVILHSYSQNKGKGYAVRRGMLAAQGRYVLLTDADLSTPIKEVDKLLLRLESGFDVAIGSRAHKEPDCDVRQTLKRRISGRVFNFFVQRLVLKGIRDSQCGFKAFTRKAARDLFELQSLDGFSFDVEILYLARIKGYRIAEVPVMWQQGPQSKVSLVKDSLRMLSDLTRIKQRHG